MTLTPEERAKAIYDLVQESLWHVEAIPLIAQAITQTQDEKLEEAAAWLDERASFYRRRAGEAIDAEHAAERTFGAEACENAAFAIRSLKSRD